MKTTMLLPVYLLTFLPCIVCAEQEMETDRPDFTEGTQTIEPGRLQLEGGYTYTREKGISTVESHTIPEILARIGLKKDLELRLGWAGYSATTDDDGDDAHGISDFEIGGKYRFFRAGETSPFALSAIAAVTLPVGSDEISSDEIEPGAKLLWAYDFTPRFGAAGNINLTVPADESGHFVEPASSITVGYDFTDQIGGYLEYFGLYPHENRNPGPTHYANTGITYALTPNLQLDARIGTALNSRADDHFTGLGFAALW